MTPTVPVTACPHCGGQSGFTTNIVFKAKRYASWDGRDVDTDGYTVASEADPRCADCGQPVRSLFKK